MSTDFNISTELAAIDELDGYAFEDYLANVFATLNYKVEQTNRSGDYGADLILESLEGKIIVIEAKRYQKNSNIGVSAVQSVYTAKSYYQADEAWIMTTSNFTNQAEKMANKIKVKLYPRVELARIVHLAYGSGEFKRRYVVGDSLGNLSETSAPGCLGALLATSNTSTKTDIKKVSGSLSPKKQYNKAVRPYRKAKRTTNKIKRFFK